MINILDWSKRVVGVIGVIGEDVDVDVDVENKGDNSANSNLSLSDECLFERLKV